MPGPFVTFAGAGFGTLQIELATGAGAAAPGGVRSSLSARQPPGVYADGDFTTRFVGAFEAVLDPLVASLDSLPEHFDPRYAPRDVLDLLIAWLGLEHDEARSGEERREIVLMAPELMRLRGTRAGLELALAARLPRRPVPRRGWRFSQLVAGLDGADDEAATAESVDRRDSSCTATCTSRRRGWRRSHG